MPKLLAALTIAALATQAAGAQDLPPYQRDRGTGVPSSMFGTYVRAGELLVYPFFEWYADHDLEYKPSELGYVEDVDYRGRYRASEGLLFLGYGISRNVAVELEAAVISAQLRKSAADTSNMPGEVRESGLGDIEAQIRWRWLEENEGRPEAFAIFETVFPFQRRRRLIGTRDWEFKVGVGVTRGLRWGTMTLRTEVEYNREERKIETGEFAVEYLRRLSRAWSVFAAIEAHQFDEVELITEVQWRFHPRAFLKLNHGLGVTSKATDFAPEVGIMLSF